jgi:hypothetical protein
LAQRSSSFGLGFGVLRPYRLGQHAGKRHSADEEMSWNLHKL